MDGVLPLDLAELYFERDSAPAAVVKNSRVKKKLVAKCGVVERLDILTV